MLIVRLEFAMPANGNLKLNEPGPDWFRIQWVPGARAIQIQKCAQISRLQDNLEACKAHQF